MINVGRGHHQEGRGHHQEGRGHHQEGRRRRRKAHPHTPDVILLKKAWENRGKTSTSDCVERYKTVLEERKKVGHILPPPKANLSTYFIIGSRGV